MQTMQAAVMDPPERPAGRVVQADVDAHPERRAWTRPIPTSGRNVRLGADALAGVLTVPALPRALVIFAQGSGSNGLNPCQACVAENLHGRGIATLRFEMLSPAEAHDRNKVFDIPLLAARLQEAVGWALAEPALRGLPVGLFGADTGAAVALAVGCTLAPGIFAIVSRSGRTDLAGPNVGRTTPPTLLIVGETDRLLLALNRRTLAQLKSAARLETVPAFHGMRDTHEAHRRIALLAEDWFVAHLPAAAEPAVCPV